MLAAMGAVLGGKDPAFDDDADVDLARLPPNDRDAILARAPPDDSAPPDAFALAQNEIRREMIDRGIQPKGFYNDDAARLQDEFNREHVAERAARLHQRLQLAAKSYLRETVHRRRLERERELREEVDAVAQSPQLDVWLELLALPPDSGSTTVRPSHATLRLTGVGTRALCKPLAFNHSLHSLTLSRNGLDDMAGQCLATMLRRNTSLRRLELESNGLGPATARALADALTVNASLQFLSLESNPLTDDEKDFSGVAALGRMLASNATLRTLNLWRTRLGTDGGRQLGLGLERNTTLVCLDIGNNRIAAGDAVLIDQRLRRNRTAFEAREEKMLTLRQAQLTAAGKERERQEQARKEADYEEWIEKRKLERQEERVRQEQERQRLARLEEDRLRQFAARKAAEFAARAELEKKKKKKTKKGGGAKKK